MGSWAAFGNSNADLNLSASILGFVKRAAPLGSRARNAGCRGSIRAAMQDPAAIKENILARARAEGFDIARVAQPRAEPVHASRLQQFLGAGHHGGMDWMEKRSHWRADPQAMWPQARSVLGLGTNYGPAHNPLTILAEKDRGAISVYAQ